MGLAFEAVGDGNYTKALSMFRSLLAKNSKRADLVRSFIDAAAGVDTLTAADRALVLEFFEQMNDGGKQNRTFVDRLSTAPSSPDWWTGRARIAPRNW
ncbi:MAG TPA: hypothetical protein VH682_03740 [Gemmataceae bacterium]|jgi:hypothetical protein